MKNKETVETGRKYVLQLLYLRSEEHTSELQSQSNLVCRLLLEKKKNWRHFTSTAGLTREPAILSSIMLMSPTATAICTLWSSRSRETALVTTSYWRLASRRHHA